MGIMVVTGVSGQTGGATARALLARGARVRAVVRDPEKGRAWVARGCETAAADLAGAAALGAAFAGAEGAYVLNPPAYAAVDLFGEAERLAASILRAAEEARLPRLVVLSSVGAQHASGTGIIRTNRTYERVLGALGDRVRFLRPAYFMENWRWVADLAAGGVLPSFLAPSARAIPMVSVADIGECAAEALLTDAPGPRLIELEGPRAFSPDDAAAAFASALGRPVRAQCLPEAEWPAALEASGFSPRTITAWTELFRGFNSGHVAFEGPEAVRLRGRVTLREAVEAYVRATAAALATP